MTVSELIRLLKEFPQELPVFFARSESERDVLAPRDAVMDLVHPSRGQVIPDDRSPSVPKGFVDALVIYPRTIRGRKPGSV